jgi:hypothetical protein
MVETERSLGGVLDVGRGILLQVHPRACSFSLESTVYRTSGIDPGVPSPIVF